MRVRVDPNGIIALGLVTGLIATTVLDLVIHGAGATLIASIALIATVLYGIAIARLAPAYNRATTAQDGPTINLATEPTHVAVTVQALVASHIAYAVCVLGSGLFLLSSLIGVLVASAGSILTWALIRLVFKVDPTPESIQGRA